MKISALAFFCYTGYFLMHLMSHSTKATVRQRILSLERPEIQEKKSSGAEKMVQTMRTECKTSPQ